LRRISHPRPAIAISFLLLEGENLDKVFLDTSVELLGNYWLQGSSSS
jgi:hypothetical protein